MNKTRKFALNAIILTATSLVMSSVSMSFTVYITSQIGAAGVGLYQLIMTVYRLAVTFATGGIGLAANRLVSEELALGSTDGARKAVKSCLKYALTLSVGAGILLFSMSEYIASSWLADLRTLRPIRILAFSLPPLSASSVLCGYFTAMRRAAKNSAVLLWEQYIKITLSIYLLSLVSSGAEGACIALVLSGAVAEAASCVTLFILYFFDRSRCRACANIADKKDIRRRMLSIAVPVALTSYLRSGLNSIEQLMIPWGLKKYGHSENAALAEYGIIGGMVMPIIMFPAVFVSSFSGLLITEVSAWRAVGAKDKINLIFSYVFRFTMLFSVAVAAVLYGFGGDIALLMYNNVRAGSFIRILAPSVCVMYLDSVTDSMLKGLNQQQSHMRYNIIDSAVSIALTVILLPIMGINGYIIVITVSEVLNFFLSFRRLVKVTGFKVKIYDSVIKPAVAAAVSVIILRLFSRFIPSVVISIVLCAALYLALLWAMGCVSADDVRFIRKKLE